MILADAIRAAASIPANPTVRIRNLMDIFDEAAGKATITKERAEQESPVAAAHRILTNSFGIIPFSIYRKEDGARIPVDYPELDRLLHGRPNPTTSPFLLQKTLMSNAFWHGWGAVWNIRDSAGQVVERICLPTELGQVLKDPETGSVFYEFTVDGHCQRFNSYDLSILLFDTHDGLHGRGMLKMAREMMAAESMAQQHQRKFWANGARVSGIVEVDTDAEPQTRERIKGEFSRFANQDAFKVAVLDHGMKYTQLGLSQADSQFIESRAFSVEEVARFTGIPKHMLQVGKESYQSNAHQRIEFVTDTLLPFITQWEQEETYKLLPQLEREQSGWYVHGNPAALMRGDDESRSTFYQRMIYSGVYLVDDCRALEERPPLPDGLGKVPLVTKNLGALRDIVKGGV